MFSKVAQNLELKFWDVMIPLLSRSTWLNHLITTFRELFQGNKIKKLVGLMVVTAFAGFVTGFLVFSLSVIL